MSGLVQHPASATMGADEARRLVDEIKAEIQSPIQKLLRLKNEGGWIALGYSTWGHCCKAEFGMSRVHAHRMLEQARIWEHLEEGTDVLGEEVLPRGNTEGAPKPLEKVTRELVPAMRAAGGEGVRRAYREAVKKYGPEPTAKQTRETVRRLHPVESSPRPAAPAWHAEMRQFVDEASMACAFPERSSALADQLDRLFERWDHLKDVLATVREECER